MLKARRSQELRPPPIIDKGSKISCKAHFLQKLYLLLQSLRCTSLSRLFRKASSVLDVKSTVKQWFRK